MEFFLSKLEFQRWLVVIKANHQEVEVAVGNQCRRQRFSTVKILLAVGEKSEVLLSHQTLIQRRSPLHSQIEAFLPNILRRHEPRNHHPKQHKPRLLLVLTRNLALNNRLLLIESNNSLLLVNIRLLIFKNTLLRIHRRHNSYQTIKTQLIMKRKMRTMGKKMGRK